MNSLKRHDRPARFLTFSFTLILTVAAILAVHTNPMSGDSSSPAATYSHGILHLNIPYHADHSGAGRLKIEVLDPDGAVLGRMERRAYSNEGSGRWRDEIKLAKELPIEDLVWHRIRYRFDYDDAQDSPIEGTESISQIIRRPVIHIIGQQSYMAGGPAAVRVIVSDSKQEVISGQSSMRIEFLNGQEKPRLLFAGAINRRGTTEAQFKLPSSLAGNYQLRYVADTPIGTTEFTQSIRLEDKVSILLTTDKPIYQPAQTIHVRALALDRADHEAVGSRKLTFEVQDSRGNKVFKKATETDAFGVASAEFELADEVNLGTYHLRALMDDPEAPSNSAEIALSVQRYVLPKFKVAIELGGKGTKQKRSYQPGDQVTGTVRANYFFGKPVNGAEVTLKVSAMDVEVVEVASAKGKMDADGSYRMDLTLPKYFAGRPLGHGAARVLIEATVKDSAGHSETRGEPITVSESPLLITAVPEGGTLVPDLENQIFILTSLPDGTPARADVTVRAPGNAEQRATTDDGGVAVIRIKPRAGRANLQVEAADHEGHRASNKIELQARQGEDQILLRTERAVYRPGERIGLKVFSTKSRGAAYVDVVKEGQTVLTRDIELEDGQGELSLVATAEMAGTVDISAYLFGRDAQPVGDHRLLFVQPADELKIETVADAGVYKPGGEARIRFHVTNSHGAGVRAALGLQVVDEAVFALAEKQPGFAKVFFYLEQEVMKPRYEIHSIGMPEVLEQVEKSKADQRDLAARALFSATEVVNPNKFQADFGSDVPMTKYGEYWKRYQASFQAQVRRLAESLSRVGENSSRKRDLIKVFAEMKKSGDPMLNDAWGTDLRMEAVPWYRNAGYYAVRSAGIDHQFDTGDDLVAYVQVTTREVGSQPDWDKIALDIEHERGPFNGLASIVGTVTDPTGAVVPGAGFEAIEIPSGKSHHAVADASGKFNLAALPAGDYRVHITMPGFRTASRTFTLRARDRAVLAAVLQVGQVTQTVQVTATTRVVMTEMEVVAGVGGGRGIALAPPAAPGPVFDRAMKDQAFNGRNFAVLAKTTHAAVRDSKEESSSSPSAHVRSYFPEALYINPEIITDSDGRASIVIPIADSITTWRMAMIASTQNGALGTSTSSLKVFQDFFVDLDLPVTLTQGDLVSIPVAIYNYSGEPGSVGLKLHSDDWYSLVDDVPQKSLEVDSGRVGGSQFTLQAKRIGKFKLSLSASMQGKANRADVVVREIEVIPNGREQNLVFNGRLENSVQHEINFPPNAIPDASKILVRLYPGPLSQVVEGMDSILRMPGGCFEQTSSSTYPNVLALDYMKRTKKLTPEVHTKAEGYIANGYQRLLTFEVPGGGFSWFGSAPANKILTAYGLMEFYDMSKVYDVDAKLIERTQQWLAAQQQADGSWKPDTQFINEGATNRYNTNVLRITAYIAWSLENTGFQGPAVERAKQYLEDHRNAKTDSYTLAVIANFAADFGKDRDFTRESMRLLLDAGTEKGDQAWWTADETGVYSTGESAAVETTGLAAQALLKSGEASGVARKVMNYITAKKDSSGTWGTTQATIMALRALLLSTEEGAADVRGKLSVLLNGKVMEELVLIPENNDLFHQFVFKGSEVQGGGAVEIRFDGKGGLAYQVVGNYFLPWDQKPEGEALSIDVAYDRAHLVQDDIATASATIRNNMDKTANMVMVDLGIPPGFELLSEDLQDFQEKSAGLKSGHLSKFSLTATQAILYFDTFAPGDKITIKFRLRAKYPIRARTFQSRVYEYYNPDISSIARPQQLEVRKR